jgi:sulfide dehydrogenase cytochrome subunit
MARRPLRAFFFNEETTVKRTLMACAAVIPLLAGTALAQQPAEADARAAGYLAANCANCHGTTGNAKGAMPSLAGQPKNVIVEQMRAFRDGKRPATLMHQLAKGYTDQQIELIADHFSRQKPAR